jgi:hypothetical protein
VQRVLTELRPVQRVLTQLRWAKKAVKEMNEIMKVSDITYQDVADYLRLYEVNSNDINTLNTMINVAKTFASNYTGRTIEELDNYKDFVIAVFVLCQDMWDNRTMYVDSTNLNNVVQAILGLHSVNLL